MRLIYSGEFGDAVLVVRKMGYAANPWRIVDGPSGAEIYAPTSLVNGDGETVRYSGPLCFPRKRDAVAFLASLPPESHK